MSGPLVGIYTPYLDTLGGGERDACALAAALATEHAVELASPGRVDREQLEARFGLDLSRVRFRRTPRWLELLGRPRLTVLGLLGRVRVGYLSRGYDLFVNVVNALTQVGRCRARRGLLRLHFPMDRAAEYPWARATLRADLASYERCFASSGYARRFATERWGAEASVAYPPAPRFAPTAKGDVLLSVGRFFVGHHCKRQDALIEVFRAFLARSGPGDWELHLAGGTSPRPQDARWLAALRERAAGLPVHFHPDCTSAELASLFGRSRIFVHAAGLGEDEALHPERFEHFGLVTAEAMSAGCVPVVFAGGGQPEIVEDARDGFLWRTEREAVEQCLRLAREPDLWTRLSSEARERSRRFAAGPALAPLLTAASGLLAPSAPRG